MDGERERVGLVLTESKQEMNLSRVSFAVDKCHVTSTGIRLVIFLVILQSAVIQFCGGGVVSCECEFPSSARLSTAKIGNDRSIPTVTSCMRLPAMVSKGGGGGCYIVFINITGSLGYPSPGFTAGCVSTEPHS